ncbi:hypothetical protein IAI18_07035 [Acetobacteraceae bacterium H6797]|nr:hypothetical protein [Acetobacteraceae bacterium H6797]
MADRSAWDALIRHLAGLSGSPARADRAAFRRQEIELTLLRLRRQEGAPDQCQRAVLRLAAEAVALDRRLSPAGRERLRAMLAEGLAPGHTLAPLFHLLHIAARHRAQRYEVHFAGLEHEGEPDLIITGGGASAAIVCGSLSAEEGRPIHRANWCALVDMLDQDLRRWLAAHPGRYLLNMTLPEGMSGACGLPDLHRHIMALLQGQPSGGKEAFLRLHPLVIAGATAEDLPRHLRQSFGPDAHLAVTHAEEAGSLCALAAWAGQGNSIAQATARRMATAAARLDPRQPGILAMFIDDLERDEWRRLRETLELEGEARRFMTSAAAAPVLAAGCATRMELMGLPSPHAVPGGELRFRSATHPAARQAALQTALMSSL